MGGGRAAGDELGVETRRPKAGSGRVLAGSHDAAGNRKGVRVEGREHAVAVISLQRVDKGEIDQMRPLAVEFG